MKNSVFTFHIISIYLILSSLGTASYLFYIHGISGLLEVHPYAIAFTFLLSHPLYYIAYTYSIIIFGVYLLILYIKYSYYALPLFIITYAMWDLLGILKGIYDSSTGQFYVPYIQFWLICIIALFSFLLLRKHKIINPKINIPILAFWFITSWEYSINDYLNRIHPPSSFIIFAYIPFIILAYSSFHVKIPDNTKTIYQFLYHQIDSILWGISNHVS